MSDLIAPLTGLSRLASANRNAGEYFAPLVDIEDEIVRVGAWSVLLDRGEVNSAQFDKVVELARYGAIRTRAFRYFQSNWHHDYAERVAAIPGTPQTDAETRAMQAELDCDPVAAVEAKRLAYLATGDISVLHALVSLTEDAGGWRQALPTAVSMAVIYPHDPSACTTLLELIYSAGQVDMLDEAIQRYEAAGLHTPVTLLYSAALRMLRGDPREAMERLQQLSRVRADVLKRTMRGNLAMRLTAEGFEKLGDFRKAYAAFSDLKKSTPSDPIALEPFYAIIRRGDGLTVPTLPPDPRHNYFVMTGFPRSGTTLLENVLAAHPSIETFEETPAGTVLQFYLDRMVPHAKDEVTVVDAYVGARERYYDELDRRHRKETANVLIDKMPMRSAEAKLISRVFPDRRYLFSIRHPFDVVLSCFKQYFTRNMAMDHFRSFDSAVALYDFTMTRWFDTFGLDDPRVHYIRYDRLVTDFGEVMHGTLEFLGAEWDDGILEFAKAADERRARTPSYQKVRQGLTIGVQTQWRNYDFLFEAPVAQPLHKWAKFFGYPVE